MNVVVCLDDIGGMALSDRRLSRDRLLIENLMETVGDSRLWMSEYSATLFQKNVGANIRTDEDYLALAKPEDFCFVEREQLLQHAEKIEKLILYKWNRRYPATLFFDLALEHWRLSERIDFAGSSHEKITKEIYIK